MLSKEYLPREVKSLREDEKQLLQEHKKAIANRLSEKGVFLPDALEEIFLYYPDVNYASPSYVVNSLIEFCLLTGYFMLETRLIQIGKITSRLHDVPEYKHYYDYRFNIKEPYWVNAAIGNTELAFEFNVLDLIDLSIADKLIATVEQHIFIIQGGRMECQQKENQLNQLNQ